MKKKLIKRYSEAFRRQVVREYEEGTNINRLIKKYGIGSYPTVERWIKKYSHEGLRTEVVRIQTVEDQVEFKQMKQRIADLEKALAQSTLDNHMLHTTLDVASQALEIDLKKISASNHKTSNAKEGCYQRQICPMVWY